AAAEAMLPGQPERFEIARQRIGPAKICGVFKREPDQPARLMRRQAAKVMLCLVEPGEGVRTRQPGQPPVERIGPGMIRADQPRGLHQRASLDQPCASVTADVEEDMRLSVLVAG